MPTYSARPNAQGRDIFCKAQRAAYFEDAVHRTQTEVAETYLPPPAAAASSSSLSTFAQLLAELGLSEQQEIVACGIEAPLTLRKAADWLAPGPPGWRAMAMLKRAGLQWVEANLPVDTVTVEGRVRLVVVKRGVVETGGRTGPVLAWRPDVLALAEQMLRHQVADVLHDRAGLVDDWDDQGLGPFNVARERRVG
jgi:hypothetical protein